jgi:alkanesulfonate monooxygenase SsuD/methylene tetrahydromethanopterin reductase-like flavin-dependent oxidoreductase (luciferase family)
MGENHRHYCRAAWFCYDLGARACRVTRAICVEVPYSSGKFRSPANTPIADPFPTLAYAAACTSQIRLGTGIVPEHNPLVLAKTVATVDRLSGGRFILGAGVGWLAEEFQALGISFDRRAQRTREYIDVMAIEAFY